MDAVELPYPVDVVAGAPVCKLMGSDGFGRALVGPTVKEAEHRDFDRPVTLASPPSIERFSALHGEKGTAHASKSLFEGKIAATGYRGHNDLLPSFKNKDFCPNPSTGHTKFIQLPGGDERQLQLKAGKVSRSNGKCSKRARITREEESSSSRITDAHEVGDLSSKALVKSTFLERSQSGKQRNIGSKRGDRRNFKFPLRTKSDYFPVKGCSSVSNLSTAGSNALGVYGLKSDIHDVMKLVNDLSLKEILEGTIKCPILGKEKGKKAANANEAIIQSVRKVCCMLQPVKSSKSQNLPDFDNPDIKVCSSLLSSASLEESAVDDDSGDPNKVELSSCNEESYRKSEMTPVHPLGTPVYLPLDLFKRLALPAPKDLDSLLVDAAKPISSSKSASDLRSGKQVLARRGGLPPFPWSHAFNGYSRTNSDAAKLATGRSTCPGKWVRMKDPAALFRGTLDSFTDLDSITYDWNLVPCRTVEMVALESKIATDESPALPFGELGSSSSAAFSVASGAPLGCGDEMEHQQQGDCSSSLIAAAQTLCEIATSSRKKSLDKTKWPKKQPSQKAMKAWKLKLGNDKPEELPASPLRPNGLVTYPDKIWPSKKPKFSTTERCFAKAPISWATPRSSRSSPSRLVRESISETKLSVVNISKPRKLILPDWNDGREGLQ
ncbi:uncharacterized protein LOC116205273 isoform X2 [Punica granatum]|uniref:Uncharacterized protein LOC116205273 isoform X2 n=1 Tax=Punica granatum TaxID=22663 RepID=A0A6P8DGS3_PUNGR|nr:uncharacterized protein LOC116205273 isoform X2 [Punica granatum]